MNTTAPRRTAATILTLIATVLALVALAAPAQASAYRYWSYWQGESGTWVAAQTGAGDYTVVDEDVQGWRFTITATMPDRAPDNDPDFAVLCPDLAAADQTDGQVRVAVVIDSGFLAEAPEGETPPADVVSCVTVPEGSTGNQALAAAGAVTDRAGLVCAINGFPADECGAEVTDADAAAAAEAAQSEEPNPAIVPIAASTGEASAEAAATTTSSSSSWVGFLVAAVGIIAIIVAAIVIPRRRRTASEQ